MAVAGSASWDGFVEPVPAVAWGRATESGPSGTLQDAVTEL
jgi:hypothetical protein